MFQNENNAINKGHKKLFLIINNITFLFIVNYMKISINLII
jgi:hypothetical protein